MHTYTTRTRFDFSSSPESRSVTSGRARGGRRGQNDRDGESRRWTARGEQEAKAVTGGKERGKGNDKKKRKVKGERGCNTRKEGKGS